MNEPSKPPRTEHQLEVIYSTPNEMEAKLIVNALADAGIEATMQGQHSAGFRAENPQEIKVVVRSEDVEQARNEVARSGIEKPIDWDSVDVGEPE